MTPELITEFGNLYLGNKMTNVPFFNAPWFDTTAERLRSIPGVRQVFNPAEWDRLRGFEPLLCPRGTLEEAVAAGFNSREALKSDWTWIAENSQGLIIGPDWANSAGTISEIACHQALGLPVWDARDFFRIFEHGFSPELLFSEPKRWQLPSLKNYLI